MASSAENPPRHLPTPFAATAAPPPTPSSQPSLPPQQTSADFLSNLLHRLPPSLSLSSRPFPLSSAAAAATANTPSLISLSETTISPHSTLLSCGGYFHLADHRIPGDLPDAAASAAVSLFDLPDHQKRSLFPANWPLGHDVEEDDDDGTTTESFCLDSGCSAELVGELDLGPLCEFAGEMEKLGLAVVEQLAAAAGFDSPGREKLCALTWISDASGKPGRVYPYVVGLHYCQVRSQKQSLLSDSGWVNVPSRPGPDTLLVTFGDIAQVWSNGKLKKVRGRPIPSLGGEEGNKSSRCIAMSLLITLHVDSIVSPLIPDLVETEESGENDDPTEENRPTRLFTSFSFEDYAWRVYHERLLLKDPLVRYYV